MPSLILRWWGSRQKKWGSRAPGHKKIGLQGSGTKKMGSRAPETPTPLGAGIIVVTKKCGVFLGFTKSHEDITQWQMRSEEHTSELQSRQYLVCRLLLEKKNIHNNSLSKNRSSQRKTVFQSEMRIPLGTVRGRFCTAFII